MKRALGLIFLVAACVVGFLTIRGTMPFMPIFGSSMEPTLQSGNLLMIQPMDPQQVKVGDIIVYSVPSMVRDYYNYPPIIAHRVIKVVTEPSLGFRTKGDNTGEDPFTVRPIDLRGTVGDQIRYLGLPLLFFQSQQGMIFIIVSLSLLALFLYGGELSHGGQSLQRGIFAPAIQENRRTTRILTQKIDATEQKMDYTGQALEKFSAAIAEYAQHLSSHTSAIQGLAEASHELKRSAAEQNRVLMNLVETATDKVRYVEVTQKPAPEKAILTPEIKSQAPEEKMHHTPGCSFQYHKEFAKEHAKFAKEHKTLAG